MYHLFPRNSQCFIGLFCLKLYSWFLCHPWNSMYELRVGRVHFTPMFHIFFGLEFRLSWRSISFKSIFYSILCKRYTYVFPVKTLNIVFWDKIPLFMHCTFLYLNIARRYAFNFSYIFVIT